MTARYLINEDGTPFSEAELNRIAAELDALSLEERKRFRDANAAAIATHPAGEILVVSGPGTGKSTLFKQRILFWLRADVAARILALSFVRKLVADLANDIQTDTALSDEQKRQIDVHTLHKYARSIVEQSHGTKDWPFAAHFRIIGQAWKDVVWEDVPLLTHERNREYSWKAFEKQLHDDQFDGSDQWAALRENYFTLCRFYNAAGFSDLILRARDALVENPELNIHQFFIFDEYQDFNAAEDALLRQITQDSAGTLLVGDDDQVLYETLKSGKASLIRAIYGSEDVVNAMLPFCGRCDFHITSAASHFIKQAPEGGSITKIYLPMSDAAGSQKVNVVACATPTTAVDYIRKFIDDHHGEIQQRKADLAAGTAKDAYLLILSPSGSVDFYKPNGARDQLLELVKPFQEADRGFSEDYYQVLTYYSLAKFPLNNFSFRKVLHYEAIKPADLLSLLTECLAAKKSFSESDTKIVKDALAKAAAVREIIDSKASPKEKVEALARRLRITDSGHLQADLERQAIDQERAESIEHQEEEEAELAELEVKQMAAVELMTIVGSKGLSADHVIIIGFDDVNMVWVTRNAFYVAMTRARRSLHLLAALRAGGATTPHAYLDHLPNNNLEFSKYTKGNQEQTVLDKPRFLGYLATLLKQARRTP